MKRIVLALVLCDATMSAEIAGGTADTLVTVHLDDRARVPSERMERATREVSRIFAKIGIRVQWTARKPHAGHSIEQPGCASPERLITVVVNLQVPDGPSGDALAFANTRTGAVTVFYDRIRETVAVHENMDTMLLAHVLAHELAHVLQMVAHHADSGIMKARLTTRDYHDMEVGALRFTPLDVGLIRAGLTSGSCPGAPDGAGQTRVTERPVL